MSTTCPLNYSQKQVSRMTCVSRITTTLRRGYYSGINSVHAVVHKFRLTCRFVADDEILEAVLRDFLRIKIEIVGMGAESLR